MWQTYGPCNLVFTLATLSSIFVHPGQWFPLSETYLCCWIALVATERTRLHYKKHMCYSILYYLWLLWLNWCHLTYLPFPPETEHWCFLVGKYAPYQFIQGVSFILYEVKPYSNCICIPCNQYTNNPTDILLSMSLLQAVLGCLLQHLLAVNRPAVLCVLYQLSLCQAGRGCAKSFPIHIRIIALFWEEFNTNSMTD